MRTWTWREPYLFTASGRQMWQWSYMYTIKTNLMSSKILKKEKITYSFFQSKSFHYNLNNSIHLSTDNFIWSLVFSPGSTRSNEESCSSKERSRKKEKDGGTGISEARKNTILPKEMWVLIQSCTLSNFWNCEGFLMCYWHCSQCVVLYNASAIPFISLFTK